MSVLEPWIAEYLDNGHLLHQKLLDIVLQIIDNLQSCKIFKLSNEPGDPIINIVDLNLIIFDIKMAEFYVLPFLDAGIILGHQLPKFVIGLDDVLELYCVGKGRHGPF